MMPSIISTMIVALISFFAVVLTVDAQVHHQPSPFSIIIDGGSTGSRLHVFEFVHEECVRRGSSRANVPMSAFGRLVEEQHIPLNATYVAEHLLPLFEYAATVIPPEYHATTLVKYQATAGMRLLSDHEQESVYDALYEGLTNAETFVFTNMQRNDIATLGGDLEGFYGAVAANYLEGIIDTKMRVVGQQDNNNGASSSSSSSGPIGALDMGGSSTQIVFLSSSSGESNESPETCADDGSSCSEDPALMNGEDFFSTSYLSYGVDQFRERLWNTLVSERRKEDEEYPDACGSKFIHNPCANKGYQVEWEGYTLMGTGETDECVRQVKRLIPHPEIPHDDHTSGSKVGGVEHPPVRGKFFAMSLYFFTLDSLRVLSHPNKEAHEAINLSWPNPSIEELHNALDGLCSRSWDDDLAEIQHNSHQFTRAEVLPHRCLESVYMVTLLKDGFGFHPSSRDITFTFLVDGSEVEWSLGMAIALHVAEESSMDNENASDEQSPKDNNATFDDEDGEDLHYAAKRTSVLPFLFSECI